MRQAATRLCSWALVACMASATGAAAQQPELTLQTGHTGSITSLRFGPDGRRLLSCDHKGFGEEQAIVLWDMDSLRQVRTYAQAAAPATFDFSRSAFSADLRLRAEANERGVRVVDVATGAMTTLPLPKPDAVVTGFGEDCAHLLAFTPDRGQLFGALGKTLLVWSLSLTGEPRLLKGHADSIACLEVCPEGGMVATGASGVADGDCSIRLWDLATGREVRRFAGHEGGTQLLAFRRDGKALASIGSDRTARVWNVETGELEHAFAWPVTEDRFDALAFDPSGRFLLARTAAGEPEYRLWDATRGTQIALPAGPLGSAAFAPDGNSLAVGAEDSSIRLLSLPDGQERLRLQQEEIAYAIAFGRDGDTLATGGFSGTIRIWSLAMRRAIATLEPRVDLISEASFLADGRLLATRTSNLMKLGAKVWDLANGQVHAVGGAALSPTGDMLAYETWGRDGRPELRILDPWKGTDVRTLKTDAEFGTMVGSPERFSPDGNRLLARCLDRCDVYDSTTGELLSKAALPKGATRLLFADEGRLWIATTGGHGVIHVFDSRTGKEVRTLRAKERLGEPAFTPDGRLVAFVSPAGESVQVVRIADGTTVGALTVGRHGTSGNHVLSADGKYLAAEGDDTASIDVWEIATGTRKRTITWPNAPAFSFCRPLRFSPDGASLAIQESRSRTIQVWRVGTGERPLSIPGERIAFSEDGARLLAFGNDGGARLHDARDGTLIATLTSFLDGGSAVVTPDNFYMTSQDGLEGIAFRVGDRAVPFDQFDLYRNRPDLALRALGHAPEALTASYADAYRKRLKLSSLPEIPADAKLTPPTVTTDLHRLGRVTRLRTLDVNVHGVDLLSGLERLDARVNGVPLFGKPGMALPKGKTMCDQRLAIALTPGENRIEISVFNTKGAESLRDRATVFCDPSDARKPDLYAAAIGVSKYAEPDLDLRFASKDAKDMTAFFERNRERYGKVFTLALTDAEVTKDAMTRAEEFLRPARADDHVLVFFAGHGVLDAQRDYYFGTHDMDFGAPEKRGISYDAMEGLMEGVQARWKVLLIDTCHSGEVDPDTRWVAPRAPPDLHVSARALRGLVREGAARDSTPSPFDLQRALFTDLRRSSGSIVISASGGEEYALEERGNGVFTFSVLEALAGDRADADRDGSVSLAELQQHVTARVTQLTKGRQTPTARQVNREQDLAFPAAPGLLCSFPDPHFISWVDWIRFLPDGARLARKAVALRVHDAATGRLLRTVAHGCALDAEGSFYVADNYDGTLSLRDEANDAERLRLTCDERPTIVDFSPDGRTIAVGREDAILLFDARTGGMRRWPLPGGATYEMVFSPDGARLAYRLLRLDWVVRDVESGAELRKLQAARPAFSPDGRIIATQHQRDIILRDEEGRELRRLKADAELPTLGRLAFLPDGTRLARADDDGIIRFWDVGSGELTATFGGNRAVTLALAFSADGRRMANANADGTTKVWNLDSILPK